MWLKIGVLIGATILFSGCSEEKSTNETVKIKKEKKQEINYGIPWEKDLNTAFKKAKDENKTLMIMAVSDGCSWCKKMKKKTLSNPAVAKRLEKYILATADRETPSEREQLPEFKHVPIIFFMSPQKENLDNMRGYYAPDDFLTYLDEFEDN
jgi:thioredoxin-related protein